MYYTVFKQNFAMVNIIRPTAVAGEADSFSSVSPSASHIGEPNSIKPGQVLLSYGRSSNILRHKKAASVCLNQKFTEFNLFIIMYTFFSNDILSYIKHTLYGLVNLFLFLQLTVGDHWYKSACFFTLFDVYTLAYTTMGTQRGVDQEGLGAQILGSTKIIILSINAQ